MVPSVRISLFGAVALLLSFATISYADSLKTIGYATATKFKVEGVVVDGNTQPVAAGSNVYTDELVRTADSAVLDLMFINSAYLSLGPTSEIKFVYDPSEKSKAVVIDTTKGRFRLLTGAQGQKAFLVKTPYGTLGVHD